MTDDAAKLEAFIAERDGLLDDLSKLDRGAEAQAKASRVETLNMWISALRGRQGS